MLVTCMHTEEEEEREACEAGLDWTRHLHLIDCSPHGCVPFSSTRVIFSERVAVHVHYCHSCGYVRIYRTEVNP
jgi:hypothetical protein